MRISKKNWNSILPLAVTLLVVIFFLKFDPFGKTGDYKCTSNCVPGAAVQYPQTIGQCRNCMPLKDSGIPFNEGIGEYVDQGIYRKLQILAKLNKTWRVTEAYPPTVRHLSFCHYVGTCADIGLYHGQVTKDNLVRLCRDALTSGFTVLNEYSTPKVAEADPYCPPSQTFETTTGANLHIQ